jgi:hypothetical protein
MTDDDPLSRFARQFGTKSPTASAKPPAGSQDAEENDAYESFNNKIRPTCLEIRCHRSGFSYSVPYAQMGAIIYNFRTRGTLSFSVCGLGVIVEGRNLGDIALALRMHTCALIEDFDPQDARPEPRDPSPAFIKSISVQVLHGDASGHAKHGDSGESP